MRVRDPERRAIRQQRTHRSTVPCATRDVIGARTDLDPEKPRTRAARLPDAARARAVEAGLMTAREIDDAAATLRQLRLQAAGDLGLAGAAFALAVAASMRVPTLAVPMLIGGMAMTALGVRAFVHRTFLVEDPAVDAAAYRVEVVRRYGERAASAEHVRVLASALRATASDPDAELLELLALLEDGERRLDPSAVVSLEQSDAIPAKAPVAAGENLIPHVSHRDDIYPLGRHSAR